MRKYLALWLAVIFVVNFLSCSKDSTKPEEETIVESNLLISYLEGGNGNYINTTAPKIVGASQVMQNGLTSYKILDIRQAADYATGHVPGAVNVAFADVVTYAKANLSTTDKILVYCYTGQSAGFAVLALNLESYDAYSLKFGMSSWHSDFDRWSNGTNSGFAGQFTTTATAKGAKGEYPTLTTGKTTGKEILDVRVQDVLDNGFKSISAADVLSNLSDYYIVNYFTEAQYSGAEGCPPGHITGARQYTPKSSLQSTTDLSTLPTDQKIVVYCWTGQNSSQVTAFLRVLGYDAYSLRFGVNGMVHDQLTSSKWDAATMVMDYDYEP
jgi:rhodanese-related sulfurtransferase